MTPYAQLLPIDIEPVVLVVVFLVDAALCVFRFWYTPDWTHLGKALPKLAVAAIYWYIHAIAYVPNGPFQVALVRDAWLFTGLTSIAYNVLRIAEKALKHRTV